MTTLKDFDTMLKNHDWFYAFSDDYSVWVHGERAVERLAEITRESDAHAKLFKVWRDSYFTGPNWYPKTEQFTEDQRDAVRAELGVI